MGITTYISMQQTILKKEVNDMSEEKTHLSVRAPKSLMKDIKIIAIQQDTTVTKIILDYLEEYVKEHKK